MSSIPFLKSAQPLASGVWLRRLRMILLAANISSVGNGFLAFASSGSNFGTKKISARIITTVPSAVSRAG